MNRPAKHGFTLLELTVVIALLGVLFMTAYPTIIGLFRSGTDAQAYNVVVAMLTAARSEAMQRGAPVAVHFEKALDPTVAQYAGCTLINNDDNRESYWCAVMVWVPIAPGDFNTGKFAPCAGFPPRRLPGTMAVGEVSDTYVKKDGTYDVASFNSDLTDVNYLAFTSFTVIFDPNGAVIRYYSDYPNVFCNIIANDGATPVPNLDTTRSRILFWQVNIEAEHTAPDAPYNKPALSAGSQRVFEQYVIWGLRSDTTLSGASKPGATALVLFDSKALKNSPNRTDYLDANGQIIAINASTGQLFPRK